MTECCIECGTPLASLREGRPADYCSATCRRMREYARSRAQAAVARAERELAEARLRAVAGTFAQRMVSGPQVVEFWSAEVQRLRAELRTALGGTEEAGPSRRARPTERC